MDEARVLRRRKDIRCHAELPDVTKTLKFRGVYDFQDVIRDVYEPISPRVIADHGIAELRFHVFRPRVTRLYTSDG